jgi:broad specificity phosphatase PhoE
MRVQPGQHLSQAGVDLARRIGETVGPFQRVVTSSIPRAFETAIAMGFAVDEQIEDFGLIMLNEELESEVNWDAGFAAFADAVRKNPNGATAQYARKQSDFWRSVVESVPEGGSALIVLHGGVVEAGAVGCLPNADHRGWGNFLSYCEGVRLTYENGQFTSAEILRV